MALTALMALGVCGLGACRLQPGPARSIRLVGAGKLAARDRKVIAARLEDFATCGLIDCEPDFSFSTVGDDAVVDMAAAPEDEQVRYLLSHQGLFDIRTRSGMPWLSRQHLSGVLTTVEEGRAALQLQLTAQGSERLARLSAANAPVELETLLDGRVITSAQLPSALSTDRLQVSVAMPLMEVTLIAAILRHGPLSFAPGPVQVSPR